jgi:hypothetical protein
MTIKMAFGCHKHMATKIVLPPISTINQNYFSQHKQPTIEPISIIKILIITQESMIKLGQLKIIFKNVLWVKFCFIG